MTIGIFGSFPHRGKDAADLDIAVIDWSAEDLQQLKDMLAEWAEQHNKPVDLKLEAWASQFNPMVYYTPGEGWGEVHEFFAGKFFFEDIKEVTFDELKTLIWEKIA